MEKQRIYMKLIINLHKWPLKRSAGFLFKILGWCPKANVSLKVKFMLREIKSL